MTPLYGALNQRDPSTPMSEPPKLLVGTFPHMVRFLLESGSDPNDFPSHRPPIWESDICDVETTIALINHGLDFEQRNSRGETLLHDLIEYKAYVYDPFEVVKLLVDKGVDCMLAQNNNGITVISIIVKWEHWKILDYVLEKEGGDRMWKIEAMEMAGAQILGTSYITDDLEFERAFGYWRWALRLRLMEPDTMKKTPLVLKSGHAGEWITSDQLEYVISPSRVPIPILPS